MDAAEILKKPYARLVMPDVDGTFMAEIVEFPGCFATGETASDALQNVESVAVDWINTAIEQGQDIPDPMDSAAYSGKLVVRMPRGLHKRAALWADREGVSLNQFIVTCVAETVGERARPAWSQMVQPQFHAMANLSLQVIGASPAYMHHVPFSGVMPQSIGVGSSGITVPNMPIKPSFVRA